jgi:hypothetical protein
MKFPEKLTDIMRVKNITAQDISKLSFRKLSRDLVVSFKKGDAIPTPYQLKLLSKILGIDMELFLNDTPDHQLPVRQLGIQITEFGKVSKINKPGKKIKSGKIKNSITRHHKIPKPGELLCSHCFQIDERCRYSHPEDEEIKLMFGNPGTGGKSPDEIVALLCLKCTAILDAKPPKNASRLIKDEHTILWAKAIIFTQAMRIAELENKNK